MVKAVLILLFLARGFAVRLEKQAPDLQGEVVKDVKRLMESAPMDYRVQEDVCAKLSDLSHEGRAGPGPYGGLRVADTWLRAGLYDVVAQALLNIVSVPPEQESEDELYDAAYGCFNVITGAIVQNDRFKSILMYENSPHVWEAMVRFWRRFMPTKSDVLLAYNFPLVSFAGLYGNWGGDPEDSLGEISKGLDRAGGFKLILEIIDKYNMMPQAFQVGTAALSDHLVGSRAAPKILADNNDGIKFLTNGVRHAQLAEHYHEGNGFGLRYEILEDVSGLLKNDDHGRFAQGFLEEGLMEEVIKLMPQEPNDLYFQDHCCQVFSWLTNSRPAEQQKLANSAAAELVKKVVTEPCAPDCTWPPPVRNWAHLTNADPSPSCMFLHQNLEQFAQGGNAWKDWSMNEFQP